MTIYIQKEFTNTEDITTVYDEFKLRDNEVEKYDLIIDHKFKVYNYTPPHTLPSSHITPQYLFNTYRYKKKSLDQAWHHPI